MPSPADFVFNRAPTVGDLPQANFDWLGNLSQAYYQGQQNALQSRFARMGIQAREQDLNQSQQPNVDLSQQPSAPQQNASLPTGGMDPRGKIPVIIEAAKKYGIDPRTALKVARSEGLADFYGDNGRSGTAFQLYTHGGLGNEFQKETGLNPLDPKNEDAAIDWAMKNLARTGWSPYKGAAKVGVGNWDGISRGNQQVAGVSQPGTGSPAPVEQPKGAVGYHPNMSVQSDNGAGPGNLKLASSGSPDEFVGQPNRATSTSEVAANTQGDSGSSGSIGPAPNVQPGNRDVTPQGPGPVTQPGSVPGEPDNDPRIRRYDAQIRQKAAEMERNARRSGFPYNEDAKALSERQAKEMELIQQQRQELYSRLGKEREMRMQTGEEATRGQNTADIKYYDEQYAGTQKRGEEAENNVQTLKLAKSLMDDPNFDSGPGSQFSLKLKQIAAKLPGFDSSLATPQEAYKKVVSEAILEQLRSLGGQGLGQVRQSEIGVIKDSAQSLDVSKATNQLRTELAMRIATRWTQPIAEMAREYKARYGKLDAGWDRVRAMYMERTPLLSADELKDTRRISPPLARTPDDLKRIGWKDGDPFRTPDGRIFTHKPVDVTVKTMQAGFQ